MDYDAIIIGAGMSGLAAGIRLAYFDYRVLIVEKHEVYGGLNSFYTLDGRQFDVGLHALTNYVRPGVRNAPLPKLLRQLRISRDDLGLCEQSHSAICFPGRRIRFSNDVQLLIDEVAGEFPDQIDQFLRFIEAVKTYDDMNLQAEPISTRQVMQEYFSDPTFIDMLLCPMMYYGCSQQHDMDWTQFVVIFKSIFLEGMARPRRGVRRIIAELVKKFRGSGGRFRMNCGVRAIRSAGTKVSALELENGDVLTARYVISSAGHLETLALCADRDSGQGRPDSGRAPEAGALSFMESISLIQGTPAEMGLQDTIIFFNDAETFTYARPEELIDPRSGVICCPNNYQGHADMGEGVVRLTSLANYDRWASLPEPDYAAAKRACYDLAADHAVRFIPEFRDQVTYRDIFTPRTIEHFTGHLQGAVYGAPTKIRDGTTHLENLFLCGTDQGFLGITGALLSGITIANLHVLSKEIT